MMTCSRSSGMALRRCAATTSLRRRQGQGHGGAPNHHMNNRRFFSAVSMLEPQQESEELSSSSSDNHSSRPRLQALRKRLAQEEERKKKKNDDVNGNIKTIPSLILKENVKSKQESSTIKSSEPSIYELMESLQHTPPIPSFQNVLQDSFSRQHSYLRISLVEKCNLRCQYCMPPEGVPLQPNDALLQRDEIFKLAFIFHKHGVDKVRLTGGEPLLRNDLVDIVSDLSTLSLQIGMTTNGVTLKRHLPDLVDAGLTHVNISLDSLKKDVFENLTRRKGLSQVLASIQHACQLLPNGRVKLNVVVMKNVNDAELQDFCALTRELPIDVRFIEWMPFNDNGWNQGRFVSYQKMLDSLQHLNLQRVVDGPNDTTKWWSLPDTNNNTGGRIGFITSMSQHFCGTCNRLRITADGKLKACLFGSSEVSLKEALRDTTIDDALLEKLIHYAVQRKTFALGGHGSAQGIRNANDNRPMTLIGG